MPFIKQVISIYCKMFDAKHDVLCSYLTSYCTVALDKKKKKKKKKKTIFPAGVSPKP